MDASASKLDEEEHVPLQRDRLDREEVDREHARGLRSQEGTPGQPPTLANRAESRLARAGRADLDVDFVSLSGGGRGQLAAALTSLLSGGQVAVHSVATAAEGIR
jgi:hypothetical protein